MTAVAGLGLLETLKRFAPLAATVVLTRGLSIVTIPIVSHYLAPADYGRLELIASTIEIAGLISSFGLADTLFRFCADADARERRAAAAGLLGTALLAVALLGVLLQAGATVLVHGVPAIGDGATLRLAVFGATLTGLIELPLAWLRYRGHLGRFFLFMSTRSVAQATLTAGAAMSGFGADGIITCNAAVDSVIAVGLVVQQLRATGIRFDFVIARRSFGYGAPLVAGALAMFVLGASDRWFLAHYVDVKEVAFYGLAAKLSLAVSLALQPFSLFWYARRLAVFHQPEGLVRSAQAVGLGFVALTCGAFVAVVAGTQFIHLVLPASYARAAVFLPWMVGVAFLNEACSLINVGSYLGRRTTVVMAINTAGGAIALAGYVLLIPSYGVAGAIAATLAGQAARFILFAAQGRSRAPIPYPALAIALVVLIGLVASVFGPSGGSPVVALTWLIAVLVVIGGIAMQLGMLSVVGIRKVGYGRQ